MRKERQAKQPEQQAVDQELEEVLREHLSEDAEEDDDTDSPRSKSVSRLFPESELWVFAARKCLFGGELGGWRSLGYGGGVAVMVGKLVHPSLATSKSQSSSSTLPTSAVHS